MQSTNNKDLSKRDKRSPNRVKVMSDVFYAKNLFEEAFPFRRYGSVKAMTRAAHLFISQRVTKDFTFRRARSIWEGKARRIDGEEIDALREAVYEETRREQQEVRARLATLDEMLASIDADQAGQALATRRPQVRRPSRMDR
ncbi:hypothetical protein [Rhizobium johnstonii]|uniref:hypothetical protein n=1 Tax=Rhizobium johnstonii TaxID=3019933 RepID=UPI003F9DF721